MLIVHMFQATQVSGASVRYRAHLNLYKSFSPAAENFKTPKERATVRLSVGIHKKTDWLECVSPMHGAITRNCANEKSLPWICPKGVALGEQNISFLGRATCRFLYDIPCNVSKSSGTSGNSYMHVRNSKCISGTHSPFTSLLKTNVIVSRGV